MTSIRKLAPKQWRLRRQIARARKLASVSSPPVAELYDIHAQLCEAELARRTITKVVKPGISCLR
ncbi:hypothetical protein [Taklimakanibacter deserti]|uniref:hypothetical protein n=1 Tax=Taklimakanibacter deserti TaxID=2267839 RepID=UPI000E650A94